VRLRELFFRGDQDTDLSQLQKIFHVLGAYVCVCVCVCVSGRVFVLFCFVLFCFVRLYARVRVYRYHCCGDVDVPCLPPFDAIPPIGLGRAFVVYNRKWAYNETNQRSQQGRPRRRTGRGSPPFPTTHGQSVRAHTCQSDDGHWIVSPWCPPRSPRHQSMDAPPLFLTNHLPKPNQTKPNARQLQHHGSACSRSRALAALLPPRRAGCVCVVCRVCVLLFVCLILCMLGFWWVLAICLYRRMFPLSTIPATFTLIFFVLNVWCMSSQTESKGLERIECSLVSEKGGS
jgi:hypothetical protein